MLALSTLSPIYLEPVTITSKSTLSNNKEAKALIGEHR